jgi:hypothetical protein
MFNIIFQPFYLPMALFVPPTHMIVHAQVLFTKIEAMTQFKALVEENLRR